MLSHTKSSVHVWAKIPDIRNWCALQNDKAGNEYAKIIESVDSVCQDSAAWHAVYMLIQEISQTDEPL